ncbi:MAG: hypothetical protein ACLGIV_07695 [Actinomycetes bacterium]
MTVARARSRERTTQSSSRACCSRASRAVTASSVQCRKRHPVEPALVEPDVAEYLPGDRLVGEGPPLVVAVRLQLHLADPAAARR